MLDSVALNKLGIPVVGVTHDLFEIAAHAMAKATGVPDLPIVATPRPRQGSGVEEMLLHDDTLVDRISQALEARMKVFAGHMAVESQMAPKSRSGLSED